MKNTLVTNLFAGPGAGKSTMCASIFGELKFYGIDCEIAPEYAKDLVWEHRHKTFGNQIYLFGKQHHRIYRLVGEVDVVVTDSPILLTPIYDRDNRDTLKKLALEEFHKCNNFNIFVERRKVYNPNGRNQTEDEASVIDDRIKNFLKENGIPFQELEGTKENVQHAVRIILEQIGITNSF